jgi:hypothetical protein
MSLSEFLDLLEAKGLKPEEQRLVQELLDLRHPRQTQLRDLGLLAYEYGLDQEFRQLNLLK